ncbi:MAG: transporter [Candidatus Melainabacteria bacterium]|nr:transporter [Candidatus Melainabacteria bacterium]
MKPKTTKKYSILATLLALCLTAMPVYAHGAGCACSSFRGTGLGGPIITIPAYTMSKGVTSLGFGFSYLNMGRLTPTQINRVIRSGEHADDSAGSFSPSLSLAHGLTDKFSLAASLPFNFSYDFREVHDELEGLGDSIGLGDLTVMGQYMFYNEHNTQLALLGGVKLPTGNTNVYGNTGERFEQLNQPGSGSTDPLFGFAASHQFGSWGLDFNTLYKLATEGDQDTDIGDVVNFNLAASYALNHEHEADVFSHAHDEHDDHSDHEIHHRFLEHIFPEHIGDNHLTWDFILEANATWEEAPEVSEQKDANHGGTTILLTPGIRATVNDSWVYNLALGFPIIEDLRGEQGGTDLQLFFGVATSF